MAVAALTIAVAGALLWAGPLDDPALQSGAATGVDRPPHSRSFITPAEFDAAVGRVGPVFRRLEELPAPRAAVVPHHLVGGLFPAGLFAYLAGDPPATIVIIGPDHRNSGPPVSTSAARWLTPAGPVEADSRLIAELIASGSAEEAWAVLDHEHAVGGLVPLIRHYLPETRVVPLALRGDLDYQRAVALGYRLAELAESADGGRDLFVLASVDFSHYLPPDEAARRDEITLAALGRGDWDTLFALGPNHLDSAPALAALFAFTGTIDAPEFAVAGHADAAGLLGDPDLPETTTYFLLIAP